MKGGRRKSAKERTPARNKKVDSTGLNEMRMMMERWTTRKRNRENDEEATGVLLILLPLLKIR